MNQKEIIMQEINTMPNHILGEVVDFIRYLKEKSMVEELEFSSLSESSLAKDWLKPEEDEAWADL